MLNFLDRFSVQFWDFDGVIKESVDVKTRAFMELFQPHGAAISEKVRDHHEANGGMSRYEKIPLYLEWARQPTSSDNVQFFCERFSDIVFARVIDAPWVPGVREYLLSRKLIKAMYLVTATPQYEIEEILNVLNISNVFRKVYGSPIDKSVAIAEVIRLTDTSCAEAVLIGDSATDYRAALDNNISFVLRKTPHNRALQDLFTGPAFLTLSQ